MRKWTTIAELLSCGFVSDFAACTASTTTRSKREQQFHICLSRKLCLWSILFRVQKRCRYVDLLRRGRGRQNSADSEKTKIKPSKFCGRLSNKAIEAICRDPEGDATHVIRKCEKQSHGCHLDDDAWVSRCTEIISLCSHFSPGATNLKSNYCKSIWKVYHVPRREKLSNTRKYPFNEYLAKCARRWGARLFLKTVAPVSINTLNTPSVSKYFSLSSKERIHSSCWSHFVQDFCILPFAGAATNLFKQCSLGKYTTFSSKLSGCTTKLHEILLWQHGELSDCKLQLYCVAHTFSTCKTIASLVLKCCSCSSIQLATTFQPANAFKHTFTQCCVANMFVPLTRTAG